MDPQYETLFKELDGLHFKVNDAIIDQNDPWANKVKQEMRDLIAEVKTGRNPRSIEQSMKGLEQRFREIRSDNSEPLMNFDHADQFRRIFEKLRMEIRNFDNY